MKWSSRMMFPVALSTVSSRSSFQSPSRPTVDAGDEDVCFCSGCSSTRGAGAVGSGFGFGFDPDFVPTFNAAVELADSSGCVVGDADGTEFLDNSVIDTLICASWGAVVEVFAESLSRPDAKSKPAPVTSNSPTIVVIVLFGISIMIRTG